MINKRSIVVLCYFVRFVVTFDFYYKLFVITFDINYRFVIIFDIFIYYLL